MKQLVIGIGICAGSLSWAAAAQAQTNAPDYFIQTVFEVTTAEQLAASCPAYGFDHEHAFAQSEILLQALARDKLDQGNFYENLYGVEDAVGVLQAQFVATHGLSAPTEEKVCSAISAEVARNSVLGGYFKEVDQ